MSVIHAVYHVTCPPGEIAAQARDIALEQTVEVPESLVTDPHIRENVLGKVDSIVAVSDDVFRVTIAYNEALASKQLPQLLNLIYGNISIKSNIRLVDVKLGDGLLNEFRGPNFGLAGIRKVLGVYDRPLIATALKPRGSSPQQLAAITRDFALGGGDIIKDDHNLVEDNFDAYAVRIAACQKAITESNEKTGRNTLYFPNILATADNLDRWVETALRLGIRGVLTAPFLIGMDATRRMADKYGLIIMAHPTFTGTFFQDARHGIDPGLLLGTFFRLAGCDCSVYPNYGGRFGFSKDQCVNIQHRLQEPLGALLPSWPAPAGGMKLDNIGAMAETYGQDSIFLVGGGLLSYSSDLVESTRVFVRKVNAHFTERLVAPELTTHAHTGLTFDKLFMPFNDWKWDAREMIAYKGEKRIAFKDIGRVELFGKYGEEGSFEMRYFEIGPGGFSSREKHRHVHCIIAARGHGQLQINDKTYDMKPFDLAHVPSLAPHQLRATGDEPFGFFCVVDRDRDRPMDPGPC